MESPPQQNHSLFFQTAAIWLAAGTPATWLVATKTATTPVRGRTAPTSTTNISTAIFPAARIHPDNLTSPSLTLCPKIPITLGTLLPSHAPCVSFTSRKITKWNVYFLFYLFFQLVKVTGSPKLERAFLKSTPCVAQSTAATANGSGKTPVAIKIATHSPVRPSAPRILRPARQGSCTENGTTWRGRGRRTNPRSHARKVLLLCLTEKNTISTASIGVSELRKFGDKRFRASEIVKSFIG